MHDGYFIHVNVDTIFMETSHAAEFNSKACIGMYNLNWKPGQVTKNITGTTNLPRKV